MTEANVTTAIARRNVEAYASLERQAFSHANFVRIYRRRIATDSQLQTAMHDSRRISRLIQTERSVLKVATTPAQRQRVTAKLRALKKKRNQVARGELDAAHEVVQQALASKQWTWSVKLGATISGHATYQLESSTSKVLDTARAFVIRQLDENLRQTFSIRFGSRDVLCSALLDRLNDSVPKLVIRTDVESFFESIDHDRLLRMLATNAALSNDSYELARSLLTAFEQLTGAPTGLPRGMAISSTLAEIYLSGFDQQMREHSGSLEYIRFVDDFVIIRSSDTLGSPDEMLTTAQTLLAQLGLRLNQSKTSLTCIKHQAEVDHGKLKCTPLEQLNDGLQYLGYSFKRAGKSVSVDISTRRFERLKQRIELAFDAYDKSPQNSSSAHTLKARLELLAGNYRLHGNRNALTVGFRRSHPLISVDAPSIAKLDQTAQTLINSRGLQKDLTSIENIFARSAELGTYLRFSSKRLQKLTLIWKGR